MEQLHYDLLDGYGDGTMCLGLPGRVVSVTAGSDVADVDVAGVTRPINIALLDGPWAPGDWILIHSGVALERMTAEQARDALTMLGGRS